jgi:hypothetical protein
MPDEFGGFTVQEFTDACRRLDQVRKFSDRGSLAFLEHLCVQRLLVREGGRYYATPDLCSILDVPPPLPRIPLPPPEENGTRIRARKPAWRRPSWVDQLFDDDTS